MFGPAQRSKLGILSGDGRASTLCKPGSIDIAIPVDASAVRAIEMFQAQPDLRLLPVIAPTGAPVGAIFEKDIRRILFNPYGHALLQNPSFGRTLRDRIRRCPSAEADQDIGALLRLYADADGQEGMILTRDGRYFGVIENRELVRAAGAYERDRLRTREAQLDRLRRAGMAFEEDIGRLVSAFSDISDDLGETAAATAERGQATQERAVTVAAAAQQTGRTMAGVATHGNALKQALVVLHDETMQATDAARAAVQLVEAGTQRSAALFESTGEIENVTDLINGLAGKVHMLAINATIEAARAGDAGRGFAVVASEVRDLARQTREAATRIGHHVGEVRRAASDVIDGHGGIEQVVIGVANLSRTVDSTVQAQHAMTRSVADGAVQASEASHEIHRNTAAISDSAQEATAGANRMRSAAASLSSRSLDLTTCVIGFLEKVRNA